MIVGITGTDGSGKGSVVSYLVTQYGFTHYSSREFIVAEIVRRGLPVDRNQMRLTANEMRAVQGNDVVVRHALDKMKDDAAEKVVIESIRATAEAETLIRYGGVLLAIDADQVVRYTRVQGRRSATDQVSFEQFVAHELLEKNDPDPHGMQKGKVMELADYTIINDGTIKELEKKVDEFIKKYL